MSAGSPSEWPPGSRAFRAPLLTPVGAQGLAFFPDGVLVVSPVGKILHAGPASASPRVFAHRLDECLIVPGFVDAHVHYPQTRILGSASGPLLPWLSNAVFPEEARFADLDYARAVADEFALRLVSHGTTTSAVFGSSRPEATEVLFQRFGELGLRSVIGLVLMDARSPAELTVDRAAALRAMSDMVARHHDPVGGLLSFAVTPRFALSCSFEMLEVAGAFAKEHALVVQTHVAENPDEGAETLRAFSFARDYLEVYERAGLIGPRTVLAHAVHFSDGEWDRVRDAGTKIAHCPDSNAFLGSGTMPIAQATRRSVTVALGSDVGAGRSFDMRRAIAFAHDAALRTRSEVAPASLFRMATLGGAEALGLDAVTGSLEAGKDADFVVLRPPSAVTSEREALRYATFASDEAPVCRTYVRGQSVFARPIRGLSIPS